MTAFRSNESTVKELESQILSIMEENNCSLLKAELILVRLVADAAAGVKEKLS